MKNAVGFVLLLMSSCQAHVDDLMTPQRTTVLREERLRTDYEPIEPELFFRTWRLLASINGEQRSTATVTVEFSRQGRLLYWSSKRSGGCCLPNNFTARAAHIRFLNTAPFPTGCETVGCASAGLQVGDVWRIDTIDRTQLILKNGVRTLVFEAA